MNPIHGRGYVYAIQYHIVWCTKYRKKVLTGKIENRFHEILYKIAEDNHFEIQEMNGEADHIHLSVSCSPQIYIPDMMKALKGVFVRLLMEEFYDELHSKLYDCHLWNSSYFITLYQKIQKNR